MLHGLRQCRGAQLGAAKRRDVGICGAKCGQRLGVCVLGKLGDAGSKGGTKTMAARARCCLKPLQRFGTLPGPAGRTVARGRRSQPGNALARARDLVGPASAWRAGRLRPGPRSAWPNRRTRRTAGRLGGPRRRSSGTHESSACGAFTKVQALPSQRRQRQWRALADAGRAEPATGPRQQPRPLAGARQHHAHAPGSTTRRVATGDPFAPTRRLRCRG